MPQNIKQSKSDNTTQTKKVTLMEIYNRHVEKGARIESYAHPGNHVLTKGIAAAIADDVASAIRAGEMESRDLSFTVRYDPWSPSAKGGNQKLRGTIYVASHPLLDCWLDGLSRTRPSCTGLNEWCYAFSFRYLSSGKQLAMLANSVLGILEPDRMRREILAWIECNAHRFVLDGRTGKVPFRISEAGDLSRATAEVWASVAEECAKTHPEIAFYTYTKQFELLSELAAEGRPLATRSPNLRVILSDSTDCDPNPITKAPDGHTVFAILFKDQSKTPARVRDAALELRLESLFGRAHCPGAKAGCFLCGKCSAQADPSDPASRVIFADEH